MDGYQSLCHFPPSVHSSLQKPHCLALDLHSNLRPTGESGQYLVYWSLCSLHCSTVHLLFNSRTHSREVRRQHLFFSQFIPRHHYIPSSLYVCTSFKCFLTYKLSVMKSEVYIFIKNLSLISPGFKLC